MPVEYAVVQGTARTGTPGTKDYTSSGFGTPQAFIVLYNSSYSGANPAADGILSIGFCDGTAASVCSFGDSSAQGTTTTLRVHDTAKVIYQRTNFSIWSHAAFDSFITDGIRLDWTLQSGQGRYVTIILFKGLSNVKAFSHQLATAAGVNAIATIGFKPHVVFLTTIGSNQSPLSYLTAGLISFGVAHNNSSDVVSQGQIGWSSVHDVGTSACDVVTRNDSCLGQVYDGGQTWKASAQDFAANGFSLNTDAATNDDYIFGLAMQLDDADDADVSIIDTPTSAGVQSYTDPGFFPGLLMLAQAATTTINAFRNEGSIAIGATDGTNEYSQGIAFEDGVGTTNTNSYTATASVAQMYEEDASAAMHVATLYGLGPDGYDLDFTQTDGTARKWLAIALRNTATTNVAATGIPSAEALGAATVTPGAVSIDPDGIVSAQAFGAAGVLSGGALIAAFGIDSAEAVGALLVQPGAASVIASGIDTGEAFGGHDIAHSAILLVPDGITSGEVFGDSLIIPQLTVIEPAGVVTGETFGTLTIIGGVQLLGWLIAEIQSRSALEGSVDSTPALGADVRINWDG